MTNLIWNDMVNKMTPPSKEKFSDSVRGSHYAQPMYISKTLLKNTCTTGSRKDNTKEVNFKFSCA